MLKRKLQYRNLYRGNRSTQFILNTEDFPNQLNQNSFSHKNERNMSYSDVLRNQEQTVNDNSLHKLESLIQNQIEQTNKLISMMSVLITKLCSQI